MSSHSAGYLLADFPSFGRVVDCSCGNVHITVGPISVTLSHDAYMQLVAMLASSASNFEYRLQQGSRETADS